MAEKKTKKKRQMRPLTVAKRVRAAVEDKKGLDALILDVRGKSSVTDYFVIVSAMNQPHLKAMFNEVQVQLKKEGLMCHRRAGEPASGWLVLDYFDVVAHILLEDKRKYYALEEVWQEAERVEDA